MSQLTTIEKLGKDNFDSWKLQIEAVLIKNDHWDYVTGKEIKPAAGTEEEKKWFQADQKARADIILSINSSELCHIKHCVTSNSVWLKLKEVYESRGPAKKATLLKQLLFRKMSVNETMSEHLNIFFEIVDKLKEMEIEIADDLLSILLLYSIPENFENFRCAIESRDELPKPDSLKIKMLEEWEARKGKIHESQNAYFTENKRSYQEQKKNEKWKTNTNKNFTPPEKNYRNFKCNYCSKPGHKASECRKKIADRKLTSLNKSNPGTMMATRCEETKTNFLSDASQQSSPWCLDSGCTSHMCRDRNLFTEFQARTNSTIQLAVDKTASITGIGTVLITVPNGSGTTDLTLKNVLCVPELKCNLLSISKATSSNRSVHFKERYARIIEPNGSTLIQAVRQGDLYYVYPKIERAARAEVSDIVTWHAKLGHLNESDLKRLKSKNMVRNLNFNDNETLKDCKICIQGKQTVRSFPKQSKFQSDELLSVIYSDLCGPMRVPSHAGSRYFATFIDDKSRYIEVSFLKSKDEVKDAFIKYKAAVENRLGKKIKTLHTDNGLEYCSQAFNKYLEECGIKREFSAPMSPQQNSRAERANRTLTEMARCLLLQSNLPQSFWAEALNCAVYIRNRCPTRGLNENKTPYEIFFGIKPTLSYFKIFGQKCFVLNKKANKGKFDPRSEEHIFVGYSNESKAYRLWNKQSRKIIISRDVRFINEFENNVPCENEIKLIFPFSENKENAIKIIAQDPETSPPVKSEPDRSGDSESSDEEKICHPPTLRTRGRPRKIKTGERGRPKKEYKMITPLKEEISQAVTLENSFSNSCPEFSEALAGPYKRDWMDAIELEYNSLTKANAWEIVNKPKHKKIIGCKWVLKTKYKQDGSIEKFKARLVAKGCSQKHGIDFEENFSPVARLSSIRTAIAYGIQNGFTAYQLDFIMAYVNGDLNEEIYMEIPEGFQNESNVDKVCLLKKSLYGLKQSGRQWFRKLDEKLKQMKFESLNADKCVYFSKSPIEAIIIVYVDDLIILTKSKEDYEYIRDELAKSFKMKDLGLLHYCLGMEFMQNRDSIMITQKKYIEDILSKFNMQESKPISTPIDNNVKLTKDMCPKSEEEKSEMSNIPYRQLIGSLMYLSVATRPDITHAVNFLSQFNNNPGKSHWIAAKRILRYLKGTQDQGLIFKRDTNPLVAFVDADWASDVNDRKSFTGYIFKYAGGAISWESRKQRTVALSTTEAEYMALSEAAKEALHFRRFLNELSPEIVTESTIILCDNQSAQKLVRNPVYHSRTKHIDIRHHFVREIYENGEIDVKYLESENMPADILTKALSAYKHKNCCELIGLKPYKLS